MADVLEYKCPCCGGGLVFHEDTQKLTCPFCDNEFTIETIQALKESQQAGKDEFQWEAEEHENWADPDNVRVFLCSSCGGELITDDNTAATFCPFCGNPTILPGRLSGGLKPDGVLPFQKSKEDAKAAFLKLCKGKPLLPKDFKSRSQLKKITGLYVPFWLYDCKGAINASYKATVFTAGPIPSIITPAQSIFSYSGMRMHSLTASPWTGPAKWRTRTWNPSSPSIIPKSSPSTQPIFPAFWLTNTMWRPRPGNPASRTG